ncbi:MAG: hypothetical protein K6357_01680 [Elusimicrobiota bacterium]
MREFERKDYLIIIVVVLFFFLVIPVTVFKKIFLEYFSFLDKWAEKPMSFVKKQVISRIPQGRGAGQGDLKLPDFKFVKFELEISNAKEISIIADFNKWNSSYSSLKKEKGNKWSIELPLIKGRYRYVFLVDGKETLDPLNPNVEFYEGRKVSVVEVK